MRRLALLVALAAMVGAAPAWGADVVTLSAQPSVVAYDGLVRFSGATVPLSEVFLVQRSRAGWTVVAQTRAGTDGAFVFERRAPPPGIPPARAPARPSREVAAPLP